MTMFLSNESLQIGGTGYSQQRRRHGHGEIEGAFVGIHSDGGGVKNVTGCIEDVGFFVRVRKENV